MKNFLLGILVCICFGAATASVNSLITTIKPQKPTSIHFKEFYGGYDEVTAWIKSEHYKGYIVKSMITNSSSYTSGFRVYVVMEKY